MLEIFGLIFLCRLRRQAQVLKVVQIGLVLEEQEDFEFILY